MTFLRYLNRLIFNVRYTQTPTQVLRRIIRIPCTHPRRPPCCQAGLPVPFPDQIIPPTGVDVNQLLWCTLAADMSMTVTVSSQLTSTVIALLLRPIRQIDSSFICSVGGTRQRSLGAAAIGSPRTL